MTHLDQLEPEERQQLLRMAARELAMEQFAELDLMYPEMVAALLKCDLRTLEGRGLERIELTTKNVRYRRADVERLVNESATTRRKKPTK